MKVEWATLCKYAELNENGSRIENFGMAIVFISNPGVQIKVYLAACLTELYDLPMLGTIRVRIYGPSGTYVAGYFYEIGIEMVPIEELEQRQGFVEQVEFPVNELGVYTIEVSTADHDLPDERKKLQILARRHPDIERLA